MYVYVGSDPGKEGWIAWLNAAGKLVGMSPQPLIGEGKGDTYDRVAMARLVRDMRQSEVEIDLWVIEKQEPVGGGGRKSPVTIATQFQSYGSWLGVLAALGVRHQEVRPVSWQQAMGVVRPVVRAGAARGRDPKKLQPADQLTPEEQETQAKQRRQAKDKQRKEILANIVRRAQSLFPGVSLLPTKKCSTPSPDMAAALLLADLARRQALGLVLPNNTMPEAVA